MCACLPMPIISALSSCNITHCIVICQTNKADHFTTCSNIIDMQSNKQKSYLYSMFVLCPFAFGTQPDNSFNDKEEVDASERSQAVPDCTMVVRFTMTVMRAMISQCLATTHPLLLLYTMVSKTLQF